LPKILELLTDDFRYDTLAYIIRDQLVAKSLIHGIPDDFYAYNPRLNAIFLGFREFLSKYGCRPREHELEDYLQDYVQKNKLDVHQQQALFSQLHDVWRWSNYSSDRVKEKFSKAIKWHNLLRVGLQMPDLADNDDFDSLLKAWKDAVSLGVEDTPVTEYWKDISDRMERRKNQKKRLIPTGFTPLDEMVSGGLPRGALALLLGGTGFGKSAFLSQIAMQGSRQGYRTAFITLELDADSVMARMDAFNTNLPVETLPHKGPTCAKKLYEVFEGDPTQLPAEMFVKYYPTKSIDLTHIESFLERLRMEQGVTLDLLVVDYFDLLKMVGVYKDKWAALEENCEILRGMAGKYDMAIWTAGQTRRDGISKELVGMDDISASFGKVFPLDLMLTMSQTPEERIKKAMRVRAAKNRFGPTDGIMFVEHDFTRMRFTAFSEDEAKKKGLYTPKGKKKRNASASTGTLYQGFGTQGP